MCPIRLYPLFSQQQMLLCCKNLSNPVLNFSKLLKEETRGDSGPLVFSCHQSRDDYKPNKPFCSVFSVSFIALYLVFSISFIDLSRSFILLYLLFHQSKVSMSTQATVDRFAHYLISSFFVQEDEKRSFHIETYAAESGQFHHQTRSTFVRIQSSFRRGKDSIIVEGCCLEIDRLLLPLYVCMFTCVYK